MITDTGDNRQELVEILISQLNEFVIVLVDPDGLFTTWHPGVERLFGYTRGEFVGKHIDILLPVPDRLHGDSARELDQVAKSGSASDTRLLVTKSGRTVMVEGVTIALRSSAGDLLGFGKVLRDVTEQKSIQDDLSALAGALDQSAVIVRQFDGTIDHWTAGCERLYGWTAQEATGKRSHLLLQTTFATPLEEVQQQLLASGTWQGELQQVTKDGRQVAISAHWVLFGDEADEPLSVIESHSDITARITVQRELENANEKLRKMALELERSNQELEEFARIASHDLSAPITSTRWLVDLLSARHSAGLDDAGKKCVAQISQGLDRMAELVDAVLAHARVGTSALSSEESTHSEDALGMAIDNLRKDIEVSGAIIRYESLPSLKVKLPALSQLFQNLLSNAIKYRKPAQAPQITVAAEWKSPMWVISIADNGIGIEPEWFERIFQPMQRLHGLEVAGSGIGLATCKKIVTRLGGSIWVKSQLGVGSTFFFTLPGPNPEAQNKPQPARAALTLTGPEPETSF